MTYRLVLIDVTNPGRAEDPNEDYFNTLSEAQAKGMQAVWEAKRNGRKLRASVHYLNRHNRAAHFQILDTRTLEWKDPIANKLKMTDEEE